MRIILFIIFSLQFFIADLNSQSGFQQSFDYKLTAELDTLDRTLDVRSTLNYRNNSKDTLEFLIFHVWMNAYKDRSSYLTRSDLKEMDYDLYFAKEEDRGYYKEIKFLSKGKELDSKYYRDHDGEHKDVIVLKLVDPLLPMSSMRLNIDYTLKLGNTLGTAMKKDGSYMLGHWYPKIACYNGDGWQTTSYDGNNMKPSDYGDFHVELVVPISFSIASTGIRSESESTLNIASRQRRVSVHARNVMDFAWFASEDHIPYMETTDIGQSQVSINLLLKEDNDHYDEIFLYVKRALEYLSYRLVPYPYEQISIVQTGSEGLGGFQYPMISLMDLESEHPCLDRSIAHHIAHQWFYSLLSVKEKDANWVNEGFCSLLDHAYADQYYTEDCYDLLYSNSNSLKEQQRNISCKELIDHERSGRSSHIPNSDNENSTYSPGNTSVFKIKMGLEFLESYMGSSKFDQALNRLFRLWRFKHPGKDDIQEVFESISSKDLDWFFDSFLNNRASFDIMIDDVKGNIVSIRRKGLTDVPFLISAYDHYGKKVMSIWVSSNGEEHQSIELFKADYASFAINRGIELNDINWYNNVYPRRPRHLPKLKVSNFLAMDYERTMGVFPHVFYNSYDGFMLGASAYSSFMPRQNFRYLVSPSYSLSSKSLTGIAAFEKDVLFPDNERIRKLQVSMNSRKFSYFKEEQGRYLKYWKINPGISIHFSESMFSFSSMDYQLHRITQDAYVIGEGQTTELVDRTFNIHQLNYRLRRAIPLGSFDLSAQIQYEKYLNPFDESEDYLRSSLEMKWVINYSRKFKFFVRSYGAYFPMNSRRESSSFSSVFTRGSVALSSQGFSDQVYDDYYFSRNGSVESNSSQLTIREGGFKTAFGASNTTGFSNDLLLAMNLKFDLPFEIFNGFRFRPYVDMALSRTKELSLDPLENRFLYSGGLALELGDFIGLYLPLVNSDILDQSYDSSSIFKRMSFMIDLKLFDYWKYSDQASGLNEF